ncbi:hypothetical protein N7491_006257 [Penicillium cf. griseofulvum]|uniref:F-box domain-containing protein n=1 Tax=Penicillium cf. griseofulvum TaxID=2972120 RepID=A0A9W9M1U9_9EURO|nr:hypothetical protein N7472_010713 [Penicillium cf. griseofulvum]KAJ5429241.1 hypothetical protein N7491_006257 [Penicillium cf. griseofulvum]
MGTMNALNVLPKDCWVQILDQISPSDTAFVVATSRGLQVSSESSLYRQVDVDWTRPPLKRVLSLFRVIHERPDLAALIHHVSMKSSKLVYPAADQEDEWELPQIDGDWSLLSSLFDDEVSAAKNIIIKAQFPSPEKWIYALEHGDPYAFVAVLLSQLHNLRSLQLDYTFVWQTGFPGLMMRHALLTAPENTLSRFSDLSVVEYGLNVPGPRLFNETRWNFIDAFPICNPEQFAGWFYLPSLKSLEIWIQSFQGIDNELSKSAVSSKLAHLAQLERLVMTESSVEEDEVRNLLSHLSSLKSLHLGLVYRSQDKELGYNCCSPQPPLKKQGVLLEGLMSVKDTVENLSIGMELCPLYWPSVWGAIERNNGTPRESFEPFKGILKQFPRLRTAELPAVMLFGWGHDDSPVMSELLPPTLQKLAIRDNLSLEEDFEWETDKVAEAIQNFLPFAQSATPSLNTITFRTFDIETEQIHTDSFTGVRSSCEALGLDIDICMITDNLSPGLWTTHRELQEGSRRDHRDYA